MDDPERILSWPQFAKDIAMERIDAVGETLFKTKVDNKLYSHTAEITKKIANEPFILDNKPNILPIVLASSQQNSQLVKLLIDAGADVNKGSGPNLDERALSYAALNSTVEIARLLLDAGADVNAVNRNNATALMYASQMRKVDVMKLLIEKGAKINVQDIGGYTALIFACYTFQGSDNGKPQREAIKLLMDNGADPFIINNKGKEAVNYISANNKDYLIRLMNRRVDAKEEITTFSEGEIVKGNEGLPTDVIKNIGSFLGLQPAKRAGRKRINKTRKNKSRNVKNTNTRKGYRS